MADKRKRDRSDWPSYPPGKYQFYPGCEDPTKTNGTIYWPQKIEYEWEKVAKRSRGEVNAKSKANANARSKAEANARGTKANATDREVKNVIEQMVSAIAQVSNARHIAVGVWR